MVLPVTVEEAVSLAALGSTGVLDARDAVFVAGVVPVTLTTSCSVAVAPLARMPIFQMPAL
jgi:hypothetical protein